MAIGSILTLAPFSATPSPPPTGFFEMYIQGTTIYLQDSAGTTYAFGTTTAISQLTGDVTAIGPGSAVATVQLVGGETAANVASATATVLNATSVATPSTLVIRDSSGNFSANIITASLNGNATTATSAGTATSAINFTGSLVGDVTGTQGATVVSHVGGYTAAQIASAVLAVTNATSSNTASTLVLRDASGNFSAGTITASLSGNATTATTTTNFTGSLSGDVTGTQGATVVSYVDSYTAVQVGASVLATQNATSSNTASDIVKRDASGNFSAGIITATLSGNASNVTATSNSTLTTLSALSLPGSQVTGNISGNSAGFTGSLSGDVTGTQSSTAIASTVVTGKLLTGYVVGSNTAILATDTIIQAFGKIQGQINNTDLTAITQLTGDVTAIGPGSAVSTVAFVGGKTAASIASTVNTVAAATNLNTASTLVLRDGSGNFSAGTITSALIGNVTGNVSGSSSTFTGSLSGDVTGTQSATAISSPTVTGKLLTGYSIGSNTAIGATDSILTAFEKVQGQISATVSSAVTSVTATSPLFSSGGLTPNLTIQQANTSQSGYLSNADWNTFNSKMNNPAFTVSQTVYVSVGGNDGTGDGSIGNPWATVSHALSQITTAGSNNRYMIKIMGGKVVDTTTPLLKPWVYVVGDDRDGTYWKVTAAGTSIGLDPSWNTVGGGRAGIANMYLGSGTSLNLNLYSIGPNTGTPSAIIDLEDLYVTGSITFDGRTPDIDYMQMYGVFVFGAFNADAAQINAVSCTFESLVTLSSTQAASNSQFQSCLFQAGLTISGTNANQELLAASPIQGTLTLSGTSTVLTADVSSLPSQSNQSVSGGATIVNLSDAYNLPYSPATPANWSPSPSKTSSALDQLAASVHGISTTAITALTGQVTATGPGSAVATIATNTVSNSNLAQMAADTIKGNNTGSTANAADLTATQVTAMLNPFVGDSGSGGTQGLVPAPAAGNKAAGDYLFADGTWKYVDQSKPIYPSFSLISQTPNTYGTVKLNNVCTYTALNGKSYAVTVGTVASTIAIYDISDQAAPVLLSNMGALQGSYNVVHAAISGVDYIIVASSGGFNLYIINVSNPYSPTITTTFGLGAPTGSTYNIAYQAGYVYLACQNVGLKVVDIGGGLAGGTLLAPVVSYTQGSAKSFGVAISGNTLYTTQYSTSPYATRLLNSWTLTGAGTAAVPSLLQSLTLPGLGETLAVSINSNTAFVSNTTGVNQIDIVDITTPSSMANLTQVSIPSGYSISAAMVAIPYGNYLFMPGGSNSTYGGAIFMYDITNRSSPFLVSTVTTNVASSSFGGISILGGYIYAGDYGPAPGSSGNLDTFTLPLVSPVFGNANGSELSLQSLTANTALVSNGSNQVASSTTTATELSYVHGVTSPIQTQINSITGSGITSLTGDVVGTGPGATATTIQPNVVTNAKLAQAPANTIKGNNTGATANELDLTTTQVAGMLSSFFDASGSASTVQTNLNNYINPTSMQFAWLYGSPHYYTQMIYTGSNVTQIIYWDSPSMVTQLFTKTITYTAGLATQVVLTRISDSATLTKTIGYSGSNVSTVTRS